MAIDERARHELHRKLEEVLGAEEAATLMAHLPPVGWADVATKHDLAQLEERLNLRFQSMEDRFDGKLDRLRAELVDRMADFAATSARTTVVAVVGSVLTATGLVFAARLV
jgi:hypothetical protein